MVKKFLILIVSMQILACCAFNVKKFEYLKEPRIINLEKQKVIYIETHGDPNELGNAVGTLYQTYYKLKIKGKKMHAPKARWTKPFDTPKKDWTGIWALRVPDEEFSLPPAKNSSYQVKTGYWEYGLTGGNLHTGPYDKEPPDGPGLFGKGNPEKYITIIRYALVKK